MAEKRHNPPTEPVVWLSLEEVAGFLGVSQWTVLRWAKDGDPRLPGYKVWDENAGNQGRFRFKKQDVDALHSSGAAALEAIPASMSGDMKPAARASASKRTVKG